MVLRPPTFLECGRKGQPRCASSHNSRYTPPTVLRRVLFINRPNTLNRRGPQLLTLPVASPLPWKSDRPPRPHRARDHERHPTKQRPAGARPPPGPPSAPPSPRRRLQPLVDGGQTLLPLPPPLLQVQGARFVGGLLCFSFRLLSFIVVLCSRCVVFLCSDWVRELVPGHDRSPPRAH